MSDNLPLAPEAKPQNAVRVVVAASIGNGLEWYDFVIYGYFAAILAKLFFPSDVPGLSTLLTMATFAIAFLVRPIGSVVLGIYADRFGRKRALGLTIWLMVIGTAMIGFAPTAATAGWVGAILILIARLLQGLAASGEFGSAVSLLAESAPPHRRHFFVSWQMASTTLAIVLAGCVGLAMTLLFSQHELEAWGWRLPFMVGLLLGPVGFYIRYRIEEPSTFVAAKARRWSAELGALVREHRDALLLVIGTSAGGSICFNLMMIYTPTYAVTVLGLNLNAPFISTACAGLTMTIAAPLGGLFADRHAPGWGVIGGGLAALLVLTVPLFQYLVEAPSLGRLVVVQVLLAIPLGAMTGIMPAVMAASFPASVRATALGLAYNVTSVLFGGLSLVIVTALALSGSKLVPAFYISGACLLSLACCLFLRRSFAGRPFIHN